MAAALGSGLALLLSACAGAPTALPTADTELKAATLFTSETRTAHGLAFIDCHYGRGSPSAGAMALRLVTGGGILNTPVTEGRHVVTFYAQPAPPPGSPQAVARPGGRGVFIPLQLPCPQDMQRIRALQADTGPPLPPRSADGGGTSLLDPESLQALTLDVQQSVASGESSLAAGLRRVLDQQAPSMAHHIRYAHEMARQGGQGGPVERVAALGTTSLRVLQPFLAQAGKTYPEPPPTAVQQELDALLALQDGLRAAMVPVEALMAQRRDAEQQAQRMAELQARTERRARACQGLSLSIGIDGEPTELEMCQALVRSLQSDAEGYARTLDGLEALFGRWIGDLTRFHGESAEAEIVGFSKTGSCRVDHGAGERGFVCPQRGDVQYQSNRLLQGLQAAGISGLEGQSFYWRDAAGVWRIGLTRTQAEAVRRLERDQAEQRERKREAVEQCRQRYFMTPDYWRCG